MNGVIAAFAATAAYYTGFTFFKIAADRMERLRGSRPFRIVVVALGNPLFLLGLTIIMGGVVCAIVALSDLQIGEATPFFVTGLALTLIIAMTAFGERLTVREWLSLFLIGAAMLMVALSVGAAPPLSNAPLPYWKILAIMIPALSVPYLLVALDDRKPDGRHARRVAGVAVGVIAGFPLGTAELAIRGMAEHRQDGVAGIFATPYPYVMVTTGGLAFCILMLGFQRCRVSVVLTVATIIAKTYLLIMGTVLFGEPWPHDVRNAALRVGGLLLTGVALVLFPHYDPAAGAQSDTPADLPVSRTEAAAPPVVKRVTGPPPGAPPRQPRPNAPFIARFATQLPPGGAPYTTPALGTPAPGTPAPGTPAPVPPVPRVPPVESVSPVRPVPPPRAPRAGSWRPSPPPAGSGTQAAATATTGAEHTDARDDARAPEPAPPAWPPR